MDQSAAAQAYFQAFPTMQFICFFVCTPAVSWFDGGYLKPLRQKDVKKNNKKKKHEKVAYICP